MMKNKQILAARILAGGIFMIGAALGHAAVMDEVGPGAQAPGAAGPGVPGMGAPMGAGSDRAMRTAVSLEAIQAAFDESDPRANVVRFPYDKDMTYKLRLREFMATTVILPEGEAVDAYSLGDPKNFTWSPYSATGKVNKDANTNKLENIFTVTAVYPGADTSLAVIGRSGRVYSFYLRADSVKSRHLPHLVAYIDGPRLALVPVAQEQEKKAAQVDEIMPVLQDKPAKMTGEEAQAEADYLRALPIANPANINNGYRVVSGDKELSPIRVFDDGYFTYFKFSDDKNLDKVRRLPVIYRVVDGVDTPVNTRTEGGTLIAETVSKGWTLRNGESHLCVRAK